MGMALPLILGTAFGGGLYVFVMPHLSGYGQLGIMIFVVTFAVTYIFSEPRQAGVKLNVLAMIVTNISVQNQQSYDFASFANGLVNICLVAAIIIAVAYLPPSPRPEKAFLRLLHRYFRQAEFLISCLAIDEHRKTGWAVRLKMLFFRNDLLELPPKLAKWGSQIDHKAFPNPGAGQIQDMVNSLAIIADRLKMLMAEGQHPLAGLLVQQLLEDFRSWRLSVQALFEHWRLGKTMDEEGETLEDRLASQIIRLEASIDRLRRQKEWDALSEEDGKNLYRFLGGHRSLSEAIVAHAKLVEGYEWKIWGKNRF